MARIALFLTLLPASAAFAQQTDPVLKLYNDGRAALAAGKYDEAQKLLESAVHLAGQRFSLDHPNAALLTYELGEVAFTRGDYKRAEAEYVRTYNVRVKHLGKDNTSTINCVDRLGEVYLNLGDFAKAEPLLLRALDVRLRSLDKKHYLIHRSYTNLGRYYDDAGQYARSVEFYRKALAFNEAKQCADSLAAAFDLNAVAAVQIRMGDFKNAETNLKRCLEIAEAKAGPNLSLNIPLGNMANVHEAFGRHEEAEKLYRKALQIAEKLDGKDALTTALALNQLAEHLAKVGRIKEAEELSLRSLAIHQKKAGPEAILTAQSKHNLGMIYLKQGEYNRAEVLIAAALKTAEAKLGGNHPVDAVMVNNLAFLYTHTQQYDQAEPLYLRSLAIREKAFGPSHPVTASVLGNLGDLYFQKQDYSKAEAYYVRALKILDKPGEVGSTGLATLLANCYRLKIDKDKKADLGLLERAQAIFEKQYGRDHANTAKVRFNVGFGYYSAQQYEKAEPALRESVVVLRKALGEAHPDTITAARVLALTEFVLNKRVEALATMDAVRKNTRQHVTRVLPGLSPDDRRTYLKQTDALALSQALTIGLENAGRHEFVSASAAWLANGKATLQETEAAAAQAANAGESPEARELRAVRQELAALSLVDRAAADGQAGRRRQALLDRDKALTAMIRASGGRLGQPRSWVELEAIQREMPAKAVLVDIARLEVARLIPEVGKLPLQAPHYVAWVTPKAGPVRVVDLGLAEEIEPLVTAVRKGLAGAPKAIGAAGEPAAEKDLRQALSAAAKKVLHPLLAAVGDADTLLVSPDGTLWLLPWAALTLPDGSYAIEKFSIRHLVSARDLVASAKDVPAAATAPLIVADPDFDLDPAEARKESATLFNGRVPAAPDTRALSQRLGLGRAGRLPGTAAEAEAVAPRIEKWLGVKPRVLTERYAVKGAVKSVNGPLALILSTHGFFQQDQEVEVRDANGSDQASRTQARTKDAQPLEDPLLRCGLLFAACNASPEKAAAAAENGILTGLEVVGCDLRGTKLVVLSACETGLGEVRNGEGVSGLRQAFQLAGAESVVATLWQIPDLQSAQLMVSFFDYLGQGQARDEALRSAQREQIRKRWAKNGSAHPYFWAAYTITGQGK